jgi:hypothetical protein
MAEMGLLIVGKRYHTVMLQTKFYYPFVPETAEIVSHFAGFRSVTADIHMKVTWIYAY